MPKLPIRLWTRNLAEMAQVMAVDAILDVMAIHLNGPKAAGKTLRVAINVEDVGERHLVAVENSVLNHWKDRPGADCAVTLTRAGLASILANPARIPSLRIEGRREKFQELVTLFEPFEYWFDIVKP